MIGEDFNRGLSGSGMNLEVWFPQQNEVTVFLESSIADPDEEQFYETSLFALFAARQISNGRGDFASSSLAEVLFSLDERKPLADVEQRLEGEVLISSPTTRRGGRKGFTVEFRPEKRGFFKLHMHGFGMLGKGAGYYVPTSTLALLCWLLRRRADDTSYQRALGLTAKAIGAAGTSGWITVTSQAQIAMQAAGAAWMQPDDVLPDDFELSAEAAEAAALNSIDFADLYAAARERLSKTIAEMDEPGEGMVTIFHDDDIRRICRFEVALAAELIEDGMPLQVAMQAIDAAKATGNEQLVEAAYSHYDQELADWLDADDLTPLVSELEGLLFTRDPDQAAGM
jgi:hypothetical protein